MAKPLLCLLMLLAPGALPGADAARPPLILAIDLDAVTLLSHPGLLVAGTLPLVVVSSREAYYKLSEQDGVLAAGKLSPGANSLRFTRPGLAGGSQSLAFQLELLESGEITRRTVRIIVTVAAGTGAAPAQKAELSGSFTLAMYHSGRLFGFRKKNMVDLLKLKTGPVMPVPDLGLSGAPGNNPSAGQSISVLGLGMALAKYLSGKKAEKSLRAHASESQKRKLTMMIRRDQRQIPIVIELRIE